MKKSTDKINETTPSIKMRGNRRNDWNPQDISVMVNQRHAYDEMREKCPVAHNENMMYIPWLARTAMGVY